MIVDCNYLCHRAFHALNPKGGGLSYRDIDTAVPFGFFRDLIGFASFHRCWDFLFCFDYGHGIRKKRWPFYKAKPPKSEEDQELYEALGRQIDALREDYLPAIGFRNVFAQDGYEADDLIASLVKRTLPKDDDVWIMSADKDLYQLLAPHVTINPMRKGGGFVTLQSFHRDYGVKPTQWPIVKAIGGCQSDKVPGLEGVGEKKAIAYLRGELPKHHLAFRRIEEELELWTSYLPIVLIPFEGTMDCEIVKDEVSTGSWNRVVVDHLGCSSLLRKTQAVYDPRRK